MDYGNGQHYDYLPYRSKFDPRDKSNDDKLPATNEPYSEWIKKYKCQTCIGTSFSNITDIEDFVLNEEDDAEVARQRFHIYRLSFMQDVNGKRSCPECVDKERMKAQFKASSDLITKTDAMKLYKLKKEEVEALKVEKATRGTYGIVRLYKRDECKELGEEKARMKEAEKEEKQKAKLARKGGKKAVVGKTDGRAASDLEGVSRKRHRKEVSDEPGEDEEIDPPGEETQNGSTDTKEISNIDEVQTLNSTRKRQKINYDESRNQQDSEENAIEVVEKPLPDTTDSADASAPKHRGRGRPRKQVKNI